MCPNASPPLLPSGDPDNENLYTDVDRFHMQKDKIALDGAAGSFSDESVREFHRFS